MELLACRLSEDGQAFRDFEGGGRRVVHVSTAHRLRVHCGLWCEEASILGNYIQEPDANDRHGDDIRLNATHSASNSMTPALAANALLQASGCT
jgi:hypothetical protein